MPVIMMSGHATIDTAVEATRIGAMNFLEKPIALQKLLQAVQQGLARNQEKNRPVPVTVAQQNIAIHESRTGKMCIRDRIYCSDTFLVKKPDPFPMQMACRKLGCRPDQAVASGDSVNDAQAARAAGCSLFRVPYGYNYGKPVKEMNPDAVVSSLLEDVYKRQNRNSAWHPGYPSATVSPAKHPTCSSRQLTKPLSNWVSVPI